MAVGKFQKANSIQVTGQLNGPTIEAMNPPSRARRLDAVLATMERWRWMPRDLGKTHVVLNIPDYHLRVYNNGAQVWQTRTVVGKPGHDDAAADRDDEVHHRQSDLERAAVDHLQRAAADL